MMRRVVKTLRTFPAGSGRCEIRARVITTQVVTIRLPTADRDESEVKVELRYELLSKRRHKLRDDDTNRSRMINQA